MSKQSSMNPLKIFISIFLLATLGHGKEIKNYPDSWWQPILDPNPPSWEILPQTADKNKNEVILSKRNELGILSNFASTPFELNRKKYASLEGFWQSMKYPENDSDPRNKSKAWPYTRHQVEHLVAFEALKAGKEAEKIMKDLNIKWISFNGIRMEYKGKDAPTHYKLIEAATRAKVDQNPKVKEILLSTGDLILRPDHHEDKDATPAYHYFNIYMTLRSELQKKPDKKLESADLLSEFISAPNDQGISH